MSTAVVDRERNLIISPNPSKHLGLYNEDRKYTLIALAKTRRH